MIDFHIMFWLINVVSLLLMEKIAHVNKKKIAILVMLITCNEIAAYMKILKKNCVFNSPAAPASAVQSSAITVWDLWRPDCGSWRSTTSWSSVGGVWSSSSSFSSSKIHSNRIPTGWIPCPCIPCSDLDHVKKSSISTKHNIRKN